MPRTWVKSLHSASVFPGKDTEPRRLDGSLGGRFDCESAGSFSPCCASSAGDKLLLARRENGIDNSRPRLMLSTTDSRICSIFTTAEPGGNGVGGHDDMASRRASTQKRDVRLFSSRNFRLQLHFLPKKKKKKKTHMAAFKPDPFRERANEANIASRRRSAVRR